jgi:hypothetical protein
MGPKARREIDQGTNPPTSFERQWDDEYVRTQLEKCRDGAISAGSNEIALYEQHSIHPPSLVRPTGAWPGTSAQQQGGYARYGGIANALRSASA